jgi:hypothetical protein
MALMHAGLCYTRVECTAADECAGYGVARQGEEKALVVDKDDGIREGMTPGALAKLRPVFKKDGTTTAGNSSQARRCRHWPCPEMLCHGRLTPTSCSL